MQCKARENGLLIDYETLFIKYKIEDKGKILLV